MSAEIFSREKAEDGRLCFTVQYRVKSQASLDTYFQNYAAKMREDGLKYVPLVRHAAIDCPDRGDRGCSLAASQESVPRAALPFPPNP